MTAGGEPLGDHEEHRAGRGASTARAVQVCRVYDPARIGYCVLVDRLWPRGLSHAAAHLDEWRPEVAPSADLRRWYGHQVERFEPFADRYRAELLRPPVDAFVDRLAAVHPDEALTLVTATRDVEHSAARVLRDVLRTLLARR
jgi:uncharacterized protein YeaO (DUF488 family)